MKLLLFIYPKPQKHQPDLPILFMVEGIVVSTVPYMIYEGYMPLSPTSQWSYGMSLEITKCLE
jgi:hypothetical protein